MSAEYEWLAEDELIDPEKSRSNYYKKYLLGEWVAEEPCPRCGMVARDHRGGIASCVNFPKHHGPHRLTAGSGSSAWCGGPGRCAFCAREMK